MASMNKIQLSILAAFLLLSAVATPLVLSVNSGQGLHPAAPTVDPTSSVGLASPPSIHPQSSARAAVGPRELGSPKAPTTGLLSLSLLQRSEGSAGPSPSGGAVAIPWSQAVSIAETAASGHDALTWNVTRGEGIALSSPETLNASQAFGPEIDCVQAWIVGAPSSVTIPSTPASASVGTATLYLLELTSPNAPTTTLEYFLLNGAVAFAFSEYCPYDSSYGQIQPNELPTLDSPAAVAQANLVGGGAFLAANTSAARIWEPEPGTPGTDGSGTWTDSPSTWYVEYIPQLEGVECGGFLAEIDGTTGAVLANETIPLNDCASYYSVSFTETGLPTGTSWSVSLGGSTNTSSTSSVGFTDGNGTWDYNVGAVAGYVPVPANGSVVVAGIGMIVPIVFVGSSTGTVNFLATGLASGTYWYVALDNLSAYSTTDTVSFPASAGAHPYFIDLYGPFGNVTPSSGSVTVTAGGTTDVNLTFSTLALYAVTFNETGLPAGLTWGVYGYGITASGFLEAQNLSSASTLTIELPNGSYELFPGSASAHYYYAPAVVAFELNGTGANESVAFSYQGAYTVTFNETGLAAGTPWYASYDDAYNSTTGSFVQFTMSNGSESFYTGGAPGYLPSPSSGSLDVAGLPVNQTINFTAVSLPGTYVATFTESGLAGGTNWSVTLGGTQQSSTSGEINFTEANGSYDFTVASAGYVPTPGSGSILVTGANLTQSISFTVHVPTKYVVAFSETGLASGTSWSVTLGSSTNSSTTSSLTFSEPNGTYTFTVGAITGYTATPTTSSVDVAGAAVAQPITFAFPAGTYAVTFTETGLSTGTNWSVTFNGVTHYDSIGTISFTATNGAYSYSVGSIAGYTASPSSGSVTVSGAAVSESITFGTSSSTTHPATFLGLPGDDGYIILGVLALIIVVGIALVLMRGRGKTGGQTAAPTPPPGSVEPPPPGANPP
jgi:hypothetical protein